MSRVFKPRARRGACAVRQGCHHLEREPDRSGLAVGTMWPDGHSLFGGGIRQADMPTGGLPMLSQSLVIARKEIIDGLRDTRSVISSSLFALMGPLVVGLVSLAPGIKGSSGSPLVGLMSEFTLV